MMHVKTTFIVRKISINALSSMFIYKFIICVDVNKKLLSQLYWMMIISPFLFYILTTELHIVTVLKAT